MRGLATSLGQELSQAVPGYPGSDGLIGFTMQFRRKNDNSAHQGFQISKPYPGVHPSLRPAYSLTSLSEALSVAFTEGISRPGPTRAMRLQTLAASGLSPCQRTLRSQSPSARPAVKVC